MAAAVTWSPGSYLPLMSPSGDRRYGPRSTAAVPEAAAMSEHERIWQDPADPTEKRDWDLPPSVPGEPSAADVDRAGGSHGSEQTDARGTRREPSDASDKRDWDIP